MYVDGPRPQLPTETRNTEYETVLLVLLSTTGTWCVNTARSVMPVLVVFVYALYTCSLQAAQRCSNYCMLSVACLLRLVLNLVYAVWRLASWRSECIDARTSSDDWHMGCGTVYCIADF